MKGKIILISKVIPLERVFLTKGLIKGSSNRFCDQLLIISWLVSTGRSEPTIERNKLPLSALITLIKPRQQTTDATPSVESDDWSISIKGTWVVFPEGCWALLWHDLCHHDIPTQTSTISSITPDSHCHFIFLTQHHPQALFFLTDGTLMSTFLCHWILITSLGAKNKPACGNVSLHPQQQWWEKTQNPLMSEAESDRRKPGLVQRGSPSEQRTLVQSTNLTGFFKGSASVNNIKLFGFGALRFSPALFSCTLVFLMSALKWAQTTPPMAQHSPQG